MCENSLSQSIFDVKNQVNDDRRFQRGVSLWQAGAVVQTDDNTWEVWSQSEPGKYYRVEFNLFWRCNCKDILNGAPEREFLGSRQKVCKHIIAAGLDWLIDGGQDPDFGHIPSTPTPAYQATLAAELERREQINLRLQQEL